MKKLVCAFVIVISFIFAVGCAGGVERGTMSLTGGFVGGLAAAAVMYVCFYLMNRGE